MREKILKLARSVGMDYKPLGVEHCRMCGLPEDTIGTIEVRWEQMEWFYNAAKQEGIKEGMDYLSQQLEIDARFRSM